MKFLDVWLATPTVSEIFIRYSNRPTLPLLDEDVKVVEAFIISLYDSEPDISPCINEARYEIFKYRGNADIRCWPPTKDALIHHIHKAAYVSGYIWGMAHLPNTTEESPTIWTWSVVDNRIDC